MPRDRRPSSLARHEFYRAPADIRRIVAAERSVLERARTAAPPTSIAFTLGLQLSERCGEGHRPDSPSPGA